MKKAISILLVLVLCLSMCACSASTSDTTNPNESKYQEATTLLNSGHYERALILFEELKQANYKDSAQKLNETKYQYVLEKNDNKDSTVYTYMKDLVAANYKNSSQVFDKLYAWKFEIAFSTTQKSMYHADTVNATSQLFPFYYINFRITGGEPGESLHGQYEIKFSNGQKITKGYGDGGGIVLSIVLSATENPLGKTTFTLYDDYGNVLATKAAYIQ